MSMDTALLPRPRYLALNGQGTEYERPARVIGELPLRDRFLALARATEHVAEIVGLEAVKTIPFGAPVFTAFKGMTRPLAKSHIWASVLLSAGNDLSLDLVPSYAR